MAGEPMVAYGGRAYRLPRWCRGSLSSPPGFVWIPASMVGLAMLVPLVYLLLRGAGASQEAWDLLLRMRTAHILIRSILLVVTVTTTSVVVAVPLAWLTTRTDLPFRRVWSVLAALPLVIPSYVGGFLLISALGPRGLLHQHLSGPFGMDHLPDIHGLLGATITLAFLSYPYVFLTVRGVLMNLDPAMEESARALGYGSWSTTLRITLPQLRPAIAAGGLLVGLYTLSDFGAVSLLRYETFTWAIYQQYQSAFDRSIAAVLSLILVGAAVTILLMEGYARGRQRYYRTGAGSARRACSVSLGLWMWPALAFCGCIILIALATPMAVLIFWLVRGLSSGEPLLILWEATLNSVSVSALAAFAAASLSLPVAVLVVRYPSVLGRIIERTSHVGYALPGVVVALSLVYFGANLAPTIYQTIWLLLFAYVVLFFPAALGVARAALVQINPHLEDAALGLGKKPLRVLSSITLPLMRSGILMGAALVFLITMKELPATLILGPLGFKTLATAVWSASSEAFFAQAAAPAITLIVISSVPLGFIISRQERLQTIRNVTDQP